MTIAANIAGRKTGETACEFLIDCYKELTTTHGIDALPSFFATLREAFGENLTVVKEPPAPEPMNDTQAAHFGKLPMPWGQHKDQRIDDVPLRYLEWAASNDDEFKKDLNRYLRSAWVRCTRGDERYEEED